MCLLGCSEVSRRTVLAAGVGVPLVACAPMSAPAGVSQQLRQFKDGSAHFDAFIALPARPATAILVVLHGNPGIPDDVKDTALWAAGLGFAGVAIDSTARYPDLSALPRTFWLGTDYVKQVVSDSRAAVAALRAERKVGEGKTGVFGYCGGGYSGLYWAASSGGRELHALVGAHVATRPLRSEAQNYRRPPGIDLFRKANLPIQLHQGGGDVYTPEEDLRELRSVAASEGKALDLHIYPGAEHGFPMSTQDSYRPNYAEQVRARAADFLRRHLA